MTNNISTRVSNFYYTNHDCHESGTDFFSFHIIISNLLIQFFKIQFEEFDAFVERLKDMIPFSALAPVDENAILVRNQIFL